MKYTKEKIENAIKESTSLHEAVRKLGIVSYGGGIYYHLRKKIKEYNIDVSHFIQRKYTQPSCRKLHWSKVLILSDYRVRSINLRRALIEYGLKYECIKCQNNGYWNENVLPLEVDHINENCLDNRPENLQFLCPNCHSVKTYSNAIHPFKSKTKEYKPVYSIRKVEWPTKQELEELVWKIPTIEIAKQYNVSDKAVAKWCKVYQIQKPCRGYWQKLGSNPNKPHVAVL